MRFTRHKGGVRAQVDELEAQLLQQLVDEILSIVEEPEVSDDPLAAMVGLPPGDVHPPGDDVLKRLLPDAYRDDPDAASDFRRYTDAELRVGKRAHARVVGESLVVGRMTLDRDQCDAWLGWLNDVRLALGTSLGVSEETDPDDYDEEDPAWQALQVYGWLGWLQESLLSCVEPRLP